MIASYQQITEEWWTNIRPQVECFVSPLVVGEASQGDAVYAQKRLDAIADFARLEVNDEINALAKKYFEGLQIPVLASLIMEEIADEAEWTAQFARSPHILERLAEKALAEHKAGKTLPLELCI